MHVTNLKCTAIPQFEIYTKFPSLFFLPNVRGNFIFMEPYNGNIFQEFLKAKDLVMYKPTFVLYSIAPFDNVALAWSWYPKCLLDRRLLVKKYCSFHNSLVHQLELYVNFTAALQDNVKLSSIQGSIYLTTSPALISTVSDLYYGPEFFLESKQSFVLYCSLYKDASNSLSPENFISPLPGSVWLWFLISILFGAVFLYCREIFNSEAVTAKTVTGHFFLFFKSFSTFYKSIVEQEGNYKMKMLIVYSFSILLITSLYKNDISTGLIAPIRPEPLKDIIEVVYTNGYNVLLPTRKSNEGEENISILTRSVENYFRRKNQYPLFDISRVEGAPLGLDFLNAKDLFFNRLNKTAILHHLNQIEFEIFQEALHSLQEEYFCQSAIEPITVDPQFMKFSNYLNAKMMSYMELFRTNGLIGLWKRSEHYHYGLRTKTWLRENAMKNKKYEKIYLTLDEVKSLFLFSFLGECIAGVVLANEMGLYGFKSKLLVLIKNIRELLKHAQNLLS